MAMMRARIEADHPEPLGRTTYMRATTVAVARPVGSMLQTVELMGSLQACYLVIAPSTPSRLWHSWDRCRRVYAYMCHMGYVCMRAHTHNTVLAMNTYACHVHMHVHVHVTCACNMCM